MFKSLLFCFYISVGVDDLFEMSIISRYLATLNGTKGVELIALLNKKQEPLSREEVCVQFSKEFDNISDPWIKENVDTIWAAQTKENQRIYNASKFRFAGVTFSTDTDVTHHVTLNIGLTSYKDLMATNCHSFGRKLKDYGLEKYSDSNSCLSHALGVGSLLLTNDKQFLFMKRALWTGEDKGKLDRPGGHPEPDNITGETKNSLDVKNEIFNSVLHEIRDEINLPIDTLTDPLLLGVVQSLDRLGRPSAEFLVRYTLRLTAYLSPLYFLTLY